MSYKCILAPPPQADMAKFTWLGSRLLYYISLAYFPHLAPAIGPLYILQSMHIHNVIYATHSMQVENIKQD